MTQSKGPRVISKFVEGVLLMYDADGDPNKWTFDVTNGPAPTGWKLINPTSPAQGILQWQGFIDISGYRPDDMVLVPTNVLCQRGAAVSSVAVEPAAGGNPAYTIPGGEMFYQYSLTTDKVDDIDFGNFTIGEPLVGFISDNSEMEQVIYSITENWTPTSGGIGMVCSQKHLTGDGVPIVGPRIYITIRILLSPGKVTYTYKDTAFIIPPMRFVIAGEAMEVPEYQLLHLMKRQVDLQQNPDVDL